MAEGLFEVEPSRFHQGFNLSRVLGSLVKVRPLRKVEYDIFETDAEAQGWSGWSTHPDGRQTIRRGFSRSDVSKCEDPEFRNQLLTWEFCELHDMGAEFPCSVPITGHANGVAISRDGLFLTAYHLVSGAVGATSRNSRRHVNERVPCQGVEVDVAVGWDQNGVVYAPATEVTLVSNPSDDEAYGGLDVAVLRVTPAPVSCIELASTTPAPGDELHLLGWGMRTARPVERRQELGYEDVDHSLRMATGRVLRDQSELVSLTDLDAAPGHSGSAIIDVFGRLAGIYVGSTDNGIVHWEKALRRHVKIAAIVDAFGLNDSMRGRE